VEWQSAVLATLELKPGAGWSRGKVQHNAASAISFYFDPQVLTMRHDLAQAETTNPLQLMPALPSVSAQDSFLGRLTNSTVVLIEDLRLGECVFTNQPAGEVNPLKSSGGVVLGLDFLIRNYCMMDCLDCCLYVRGSGPATNTLNVISNSLHTSGFHAIELDNHFHNQLTCPAIVKGVAVSFLPDTGAFVTILDERMIRRLGLSSEPSGWLIGGIGGVADQRLRKVLLASLKFGDVELKGVTVGVAQLGEWGLADRSRKSRGDEAIYGLLGGDLLPMNEAIFDFRGGNLWLRPKDTK